MNNITILYIHSTMFHGHTWQQAANLLRDYDITLLFVHQSQALEMLNQLRPDILVAELSVGESYHDEIISKTATLFHRLGLAPESPLQFSTFDPETINDFKDYTDKLSVANYKSAILLLAARAGYNLVVPAKNRVQSCGIYHPATSTIFHGIDDYLQWRQGCGLSILQPVGIIFYYGQLVDGHLDEIKALVTELEGHAICPISVFSAGIEQENNIPDWYHFFESTPNLNAIISCLAGRLLKHRQDTILLEKLDVPIIQAIRSHSQTPEQWFNDPVGIPAMSAVFSQTYPEMFGAVRPTMIAGLKEAATEGGKNRLKSYTPVPEKIAQLGRRLDHHCRLRQKPRRRRKITIILHNNPCKGVEATVGMAVGLDTFASLGLLIKALANSGYDISDCPTDGSEILTAMMEKKAIAEFRWTTIDEIVAKNGVLYMMDELEYRSWFEKQHKTVQEKIIGDWGPFPGQSMAWRDNDRDVLVITGLRFGNITIINQPKRGCYGSKCTGEVCRILHDPELSPPHHWYATYLYIQKESDAIIHFGTEGCLEYLPGKHNGLSTTCFPEISLGDLPNFYLYVMDGIGEGMVAKRRGQATLVDHLGPVFSPAVIDENLLTIANLLDQYSQAKSTEEHERTMVLREKLRRELAVHFGEDNEKTTFDQQLDIMRRRIDAIQRTLAPEGLHILGQPPSPAGRGRLLATMLRKPVDNVPCTDEIGNLQTGTGSNHGKTARFITEINAKSCCNEILTPELKNFCLDVEKKLNGCRREIDNLLHCLDGGYIQPGPAGSLSSGGIETLPTGKNFYGKDISLLPTRAAHRVGVTLANQLLTRYFDEEGRFPEQIGISIWSSDALKSDGELFCQILHLLGVQPSWNRQGKVTDLDIIPLGELTINHAGKEHHRPRVDVTIETSSIMRDMVPHFCELLDRAVLLVCALNEPYSKNFIKKHTEQTLAELRSDTQLQLSGSEMQRLASFRIFSSGRGSYGNGLGLALDASAWTTDKELTEIAINRGGHAYGHGEKITAAHDMLARQLARLDIAYTKQASEEYDILDCSCYAVSQGAMATAARTLAKKRLKLYWAEAGSTNELCDIQEKLERSMAARLLNTGWIEAMKKHGQQGAIAVSSGINNLYKWSATSHEVKKDLFDRLVSTYILDPENSRWLLRNNPYAMEEITRRLLEANSRNLWRADEDMLAALQQMALDIEGEMEESMGSVNSDFQGGNVEVLGYDKVDKWHHDWKV